LRFNVGGDGHFLERQDDTKIARPAFGHSRMGRPGREGGDIMRNLRARPGRPSSRPAVSARRLAQGAA
jgi:hypothetical protein